MKKPSLEDLACLIMWPKRSVGYYNEALVVRLLLTLCEEHGFGRIAQLAQQIEDIWRNPGRVEFYKQMQREHELLMGWPETREEIQAILEEPK